MEIIIKPNNSCLKEYIDLGINTFLLPLKDFSVEYENYFELNEIKALKDENSEMIFYVSMNKNIFNGELKIIEELLVKLDNIGVAGIFFYDDAILSICKRLNLNISLIWSPTFMVTNSKTCDYYYNKGVSKALLSKEITKDEILSINKNTKMDLIVELVSKPVVATSKRHLVTNYYKNYQIDEKNTIDIIETKSKQKYISFEDNNGSSFVLDRIMNGSSILKELLENRLSSIYLKEDFIEHDTFIKCISNIKYFIDNYNNMSDEEYNKWLESQNELLGRYTNFFYRETIYKVK